MLLVLIKALCSEHIILKKVCNLLTVDDRSVFMCVQFVRLFKTVSPYNNCTSKFNSSDLKDQSKSHTVGGAVVFTGTKIF